MRRLIQMESTTLQQLLEVLDTLETRIALLSADRATEKELKDLNGRLEEMASSLDQKEPISPEDH